MMNNLKEIREKKKLTQKEASRVVGMRLDIYMALEEGVYDDVAEMKEMIPKIEEKLTNEDKVDLPTFSKPIFMCPVITKGGTGKTTSVIGLAGALAEKGFQVLIVDCTEQMDATMSFFSDEEVGDKGTVLDAMQEVADIRNYILNTADPMIDLVPGDYRLDDIDQMLAKNIHKDILLKTCFSNLVKENIYDFVLIDTSNHLGSFADVIWMSNERVYYYMVIRPQSYSLSQFSRTLDNVREKEEEMRKFGNDFVNVGIFMNEVDSRTTSSKQIGNLLEEMAGEQYINQYVHRDENINKSQAFKIPIVQYSRSSKASKDFIKVADEIVKRIEVYENGKK